MEDLTATLKTKCGFVLCAAVLFLLVVSPGSTGAATAARTVTGEILKIDGEFYVIRERTGQEVRVHVDDKTDRLDHAVLQVGDPVRAYVTPEGHATSIKNLGPADHIEPDDIRKPGMTPSK
jgi:hypothetical protein